MAFELGLMDEEDFAIWIQARSMRKDQWGGVYMKELGEAKGRGSLKFRV